MNRRFRVNKGKRLAGIQSNGFSLEMISEEEAALRQGRPYPPRRQKQHEQHSRPNSSGRENRHLEDAGGSWYEGHNLDHMDRADHAKDYPSSTYQRRRRTSAANTGPPFALGFKGAPHKDPRSPFACIDLEYEHRMQRNHCCWVDSSNSAEDEGRRGHFLQRDWLCPNDAFGEVHFRANSAVTDQIASSSATTKKRKHSFDDEDAGDTSFSDPISRPLMTMVHTHVRNLLDETIVHDRHPFIAMLYLLRNAQSSSIVYISAPILTDMHVIDELCYYAKPRYQGGKHLAIRIVIGPQEWAVAELQNYVDGGRSSSLTRKQNSSTREDFRSIPTTSNPMYRRLRQEAIGRLQIRQYGTVGGPNPCQSQTKAITSTAGALIGSYNFTYASRFSHREDGCFIPPSPDVDDLQSRLHSVWNEADPINLRPDNVDKEGDAALDGLDPFKYVLSPLRPVGSAKAAAGLSSSSSPSPSSLPDPACSPGYFPPISPLASKRPRMQHEEDEDK